MKRPIEKETGLTLTLVATLAVAACNQAQDRSYEVDATDEGGGELIVSDVDPNAVPVELPKVEMTNVPAEEAEAEAEGETDAN